MDKRGPYTVTRTCSGECARRSYTARKKAGKIERSNQQTQVRTDIKAIETIKSKEFLTVRDAATLLSSSRQTIYNLIQTGILPAVNISVKKTLIRRSAIDQLFAGEPVTPLAPAKPVDNTPLSECYTLQETQKKYAIAKTTLKDLIKRHAIPTQYKGKYGYVSKVRIDELLADETTS